MSTPWAARTPSRSNDLSKTSVKHVAIDLSSTPGSGVGDGQADTVVINATNGDDVINVTDDNGVVTVSGLATDVTITGFEAQRSYRHQWPRRR